MKRLIAGAVAAACTTVLHGAAGPGTASPFYLEQTETLEGGKPLTYVLARNADGAVVRKETGGAVDVRDIFFPDGRAVSVFDTFKMKVTWPKGTKRQGAPGIDEDSTPDCNVENLDALGQPTDPTLGLESVLGEAVVVSEAKMSGFTIVTWRAPRLSCEELYYRSEKTDAGGSHTVVAEMTTKQLLVSEPDPQLFVVNPKFVEIEAAERYTSLVGLNGLPLPDDERERLVGKTPSKTAK